MALEIVRVIISTPAVVGKHAHPRRLTGHAHEHADVCIGLLALAREFDRPHTSHDDSNGFAGDESPYSPRGSLNIPLPIDGKKR